MPRKKLFSGGTYGIKKNGKWGKLTASEIIEKMVNDGFIPHNMDIAQKKTVNEEYKHIAEETNKKLNILQEYLQSTDSRSVAYEDMEESGGELPVNPPKSLQEMIVELTRAKIFNDSDVSSPEGVEDFYRQFAEEYESETDADEDTWFKDSKRTANDKWTLWRRIEQLAPNLKGNKSAMSEALDEIESAIMDGLTNDEYDSFVIDLTNRLSQKYKSFQNRYRANRREL